MDPLREPIEPPHPKYWAFLSYSHQDNLRTRKDGRTDRIQWAEWLLGAIETYRVPVEFKSRLTAMGEPMPARFFPLFQDEKELPINADLGGSIRAALDQSRFLIVICSPRSAASRYVDEEVRYFKRIGRKDRILALIIDGEPNATLGNKPGYTAVDDCFCPALRGAPRPDGIEDAAEGDSQEPIAGDVRIKDAEEVREPKQSDLPSHRHVLGHMRLKLLSALMGVGFDELVQRDAARRRRRRRLIASASATLLLVFAALSVISTLFYFRASRAERATKEALARSIELLQTAARNDVWEAHDLFRQGRDVRAFALLARALEYDPDSRAAVQTAIGALNSTLLRPCVATLSGHGKAVNTATFTSDGERIATASEDGTARIWEAGSGRVLALLAGHEGAVKSARFDADGTRVVTASDDRTARVWDAVSGRLLLTIPHGAAVRRAGFSHDGTRVLTVSEDRRAQLWDALTGKLLMSFSDHDGAVYSASFDAHDRRVVTSSNDTRARVWDAATGKLLAILKGHKGAVHSAFFSEDGTRIVTASSDQSARVWDAANGNPLVTLTAHGRSVLGASFSPDGSRVLTASDDHTARVWDARTGRLLATLSGHEGPVKNARFSEDGIRVVTASDDGTARLWDAATGRLRATLAGHGGPVQNAGFSADGRSIVSASTDGCARIWEAGQTNFLVAIAGHDAGVRRAHISADGGQLLTVSDDQTARLWESVSGKLVARFAARDDRLLGASFGDGRPRIITTSWDRTVRVRDAVSGDLITTLARPGLILNGASFSEDGSRLVTADDDRIARVWDAASGKLVATLSGHEGPVKGARFSADTARVVTASDDGAARIWNGASGQLLATLSGHAAPVSDASFSPDGRLVATASEDRTARVWDAESGRLVATFSGHGARVRTASFSANGGRVVTASFDRTARVWETYTGKLLATLSGHDAEVVDASFSADDVRIVTASSDQTARVWILPPADQRAPEWFPLFLRWRVSSRFDDDGVFRAETASEQSATRQRLDEVLGALTSATEDSPYVRIATWFFVTPDRRTVHPFTAETMPGTADRLIHPDAIGAEVARAYELDPLNPLIYLARAKWEVDVARGDFLREYGRRLLPADAAPEFLHRSALLLAAPPRPGDVDAPQGATSGEVDFTKVTREAPFENGLGMRFVPIAHTPVLFSRWVTRVRDYARFATETNREWPRPSFRQSDTHPAVNVHWVDANAFCEWLTQRERAAGRVGPAQRYRLPTDREWSAAADLPEEAGATPRERSRAGVEQFPWGAQWPPPLGAGNYDQRLHVDDDEFTSPVGTFGTDRSGLCDLGGNVWQWCEDRHDEATENRALRGGSWADILRDSLLSRYRASRGPLDRHPNFGFRIVLAPAP